MYLRSQRQAPVVDCGRFAEDAVCRPVPILRPSSHMAVLNFERSAENRTCIFRRHLANEARCVIAMRYLTAVHGIWVPTQAEVKLSPQQQKEAALAQIKAKKEVSVLILFLLL